MPSRDVAICRNTGTSAGASRVLPPPVTTTPSLLDVYAGASPNLLLARPLPFRAVPIMSDPPKKSSEANDAATRLKRITELWRRLRRTRSDTPTYDILIDQIRTETDAFRKILDTKKELGSQDPKD